ncbi:MAG: trypsin-like serine protease [Polyangiales bacterium]
MNTLRTLLRLSLTLSFSTLAACTVARGDTDAQDDDENISSPTKAPIIGASTATAYPEAALIDMWSAGSSYANYMCSGAVIAPQVVLTAGHCVQGTVKWKITTPFAGKQTVTTTTGATYDWDGSSGESVNPNQHDIGLIFLPTPITLSSYPSLATASQLGKNIRNIGRIQDGTASNTALFYGASVKTLDGSAQGYKYDYYTNDIIQPGDSGGPDIVDGSSPHLIAAVNSGAGSGTQVLARVDLVYSWIDSQVKAHGGWASSGGSSGGGTTPPPPPPPPPPSGCSGTAEVESNDSYTTPNALSGTACGSLGAGDQDWYSWSVGSTATAYDVKLTGSSDMQIQMWKNVGGSYYSIANTSSTEINKTSNGAGTYVVVVYSPSGATGSYSLTLKK